MSYRLRGDRYLENEVLSRSPEWLVPLLYEHLLSALHRADACIEAKNLEGKAVSLGKANAIVLELASTLDPEQGGEIASGLGSLYAFFAGELMDIGKSLDRQRLGRLIPIIAELHEAWVEAAEQVAPRGRMGAAAQPTALSA